MSLIDKTKWQDILSRFVSVLKVNIVLIDRQGKVIIPAYGDHYGWSFFEKNCLSVGFSQSNAGKILGRFTQTDEYGGCFADCGFYCYSIPLFAQTAEPVAYLVVGPCILSKREDGQVYKEIAGSKGLDYDQLMAAVSEVRVVSHVSLKAMLDLLAEVGRDVLELELERQKIKKLKDSDKDPMAEVIHKEVGDMYNTIHMDELLVTLLDLALKLTNTECGSIMVLDSKRKELVVKVSRGIDKEKTAAARIKLGEGIAGLAAQENSSFIIHGTQGDSRIQSHLARPDIKHAIVMPLTRKEHVFGVLNVHTKMETSKIDSSINNLQYLTRLISAAFQSIK